MVQNRENIYFISLHHYDRRTIRRVIRNPILSNNQPNVSHHSLGCFIIPIWQLVNDSLPRSYHFTSLSSSICFALLRETAAIFDDHDL